MSSLKGARGKQCGVNCCKKATYIPSCARSPASSTPKASKPMCCSSTASQVGNGPGRRKSGSTTIARISTTPSSKIRSPAPTWMNLWPTLTRPTGMSGNGSEETPEGRWRAYTIDDILARDKANLDIFWLRDESLEDTDNLPDPDIIAVEIVEELEAALEQFRLIAEDLGTVKPPKPEPYWGLFFAVQWVKKRPFLAHNQPSYILPVIRPQP